MRRRPSARLVATAFAVLAALAPAAAEGKAHSVTAAGGPASVLWRWDPAQLTISVGDKVVWENPTSSDHHVAPYEGNWSQTLHVGSGGKATMRFKKPGTYRYRCDVPRHSELIQGICVGQCGTIVVE